MATAQDILKKSKRKTTEFTPKKRRPWDYMANLTPGQEQTKPESNNRQELIAKENNTSPKTRTTEGTEGGTKEHIQGNSKENKRTIQGTEEGTDGYNNGDVRGNNERNTKHGFHHLEHEISRLTGIQKNIFYILLELSEKSDPTSAIFIKKSTLSEITNTSTDSIKTSIKRLVSKGLLIREEGLRARGGGLNLRISEDTKKALIEHKNKLELHQQIKQKQFMNPLNSLSVTGDASGNAKGDNLVYSSSYLNNTTTKSAGIENDWGNINYEPLKEIHFSSTQLRQLANLDCVDPKVVQDSIYRFAYTLRYKPDVVGKFKSGPLNVLMGILRKGESWVEDDYKSPKEIALEKLIERKRAESERMRKLEIKAYGLALETWKSTLSENDVETIAPNKPQSDGGGRMVIRPRSELLDTYFRKNEWPKVKHEYTV